MPKAMMRGGSNTKRIAIERYRGVDFSQNPGEVDISRSPDALNMIADQGGRPVKRMGYEMIAKTPGKKRINGIHRLVQKTGETLLLHAGETLYVFDPDAKAAKVLDFSDIDFNNFTFNDDPFDPTTREGMTPLYEGMADGRSQAFQMEGKLWIVDGKKLLCYDGSTVRAAEDMAYVPTTCIGAPPQGGGKKFEDRNLLSDLAINSFFVSEDNKYQTEFQLDTKDYTRVLKVERLTASGTWEEHKFIHSTWEQRRLGTLTLFSAPGASPISGEDNVRITFEKKIKDGKEKINRCKVGILWGIGGNNRIFLTGNSEFVNLDFGSEISTPERPAPTYFPENGYATVGQDNSRVMGYLRMGETLAVLKEGNDQDATAYIRSGVLKEVDGTLEVMFSLKEGIAGVGAISPYCMNELRDDPLYLSQNGVFALSSNAVTSERCAQPRSETINKMLCMEENLHEAVAVEFEGYWYLCVNGHVYVADSSQRTYRGKTGDQYQYEWYFFDNIPARVFFKHKGKLWFGTERGEIFRFYTKRHSLSYNDNGAPIRAYWTTPELQFDSYSVYKTIRRIYSKLTPYARSSVRVWLKEDGGFKLVDEKNVDVFDFGDINFNRFTFNLNRDVGVIATKVKSKRIVTTQIRLENKRHNEAFGITSITVYYDAKNKVK